MSKREGRLNVLLLISQTTRLIQMTVPSETLTNIYSAAVDPTLWFGAIDQCVNHIGATSAALIHIDTLGTHSYGLNVISEHLRRTATDEDMHYWLTELSKYDFEGHEISLNYQAQTVYRDLDLWPNVTELDQRADYQFLQKKFGIRRKLGARLSDNKRYVDTFGLHFPADWESVPANNIASMGMLLPHIAKAVEIGAIFDRLQKQYAAVLSALNHVGIGLCVVQSNGVVVVSNSEATRILESGSGIKLGREKRLICSSETETEHLAVCIKQAAISSGHVSTAAERIISLQSKMADSNPIILEVSPIQDHLQETDVGNNAVLVQIIDVNCHRHCSVDAFSIAYGLTSAEKEVAKLLLEGLQNNEIADFRNTSKETAKSQVSQIMRKGGVKSRVQLIRLILKTDPPVNAKK